MSGRRGVSAPSLFVSPNDLCPERTAQEYCRRCSDLLWWEHERADGLCAVCVIWCESDEYDEWEDIP